MVVFAESGYTFAALTARVNELLCAAGMRRSPYHVSTIFRLITGASAKPRDGDAPVLISQAFSLKLGRLVHPAELWPDLDFAVLDAGFDYRRDLGHSIAVVTGLWEWSGMSRRAFTEAGFVSGALALPALRWLVQPPDRVVAHEHPTVAGADVDAMRSFATTFRQLDAKHGGGQVLPLVTAYLRSEVAPRLRHARFSSEAVGRQVFGQAAVLTHMLAGLCQETGRDGLAQRHYVQALRLAKAADDLALGVFCLAGASWHARQLGHLDDALDAALGAREGVTRLDSPPVRLTAWVHALEAQAWAALGPSHRREAHAAIGRVWDAFEHADDDERGPDWIAYIDEASLAGEVGHAHRNLDEPAAAERHADRVLALRDESRARSRAFAQILLASAHADQRRIDTAAQIASSAVESIPALRSRPAHTRYRTLHTTLMRHRGTCQSVRELDEKTRALMSGR